MNSQGVSEAYCEVSAKKFRVRGDGSIEWLEDLGVISTSELKDDDARELHRQLEQTANNEEEE